MDDSLTRSDRNILALLMLENCSPESSSFESPWLHAIPQNNLSNITISLSLYHTTNKASALSWISSTHLLVCLLARTKSCSEITRRDTPHLHAIFLQHPVPLPHHHIHACLTAPVGWYTEVGFRPAFGWMLIDE